MRVSARFTASAFKMTDERGIRQKKSKQPRTAAIPTNQFSGVSWTLATSLDRLKGMPLWQIPKALVLGVTILAASSPFAAVFHNPIGKRALESDIVAGFFRFDPFVLENLFAFGLEFAIERGFAQ
jgi:hypothetical protein